MTTTTEPVSQAAWLTVDQAAARLQLQPATVRAAIRAGRLPARDVAAGTRVIYRLALADVDAYGQQ